MKERPYNEANLNFLFEEIAIAHILRQHLVDLPRTLVQRDIWRVIVYPGSPVNGDVYQWQHKILPQKDTTNPHAGGQYNFDTKSYYLFDEIQLDSPLETAPVEMNLA